MLEWHSHYVSLITFLSDFGMGAPKQANKTLDSQPFWKFSPKEDFSIDELFYYSRVSW